MVKANGNLRELRLQFTGPTDTPDNIPLDGVVNSMKEFSNIVHLLANYLSEREHSRLENSTAEFYSAQSLTCHAVRRGCLEIAVALGPELATIFNEDSRRLTVEHWNYVHGTLQATNKGDEEQLEGMFPDESFRRQLLMAFGTFDAKQTMGFHTRILDNKNQPIYDGKRRPMFSLEPKPGHLEVGEVGEPIKQEYFGVLDTIKVGSMHQVGTKYLRLKLLQGGVLKVPYTDFHSMNLPVDNDTLIKVGGIAKEGNVGSSGVVQMTKLENVAIVEEARITRTEFMAGGLRYEMDPPLEFRVVYDQSDQVYDVTGDLEVDIAVVSASEIRSALDSVLGVRWNRLGNVDPSELTPRAARIRSEMRNRMKGTANDH